LAIGAAALVDFSVGGFAFRLHCTHDRAARGMRLQNLPEETPEGAHPGENSSTAAGSALGLDEQGAGQESRELVFDFRGTSIRLSPPSERREFRPPSRNEGSIGIHRAVYIPLY
jgi:hypothetical protein